MTIAGLAEAHPHVLSELHLENFRCIAAADLQLHTRLNVLTGGNGAGKTSVLEAIHVLSRGRSFRTADNHVLIRSGTSVARVSGLIWAPPGHRRAALQIGAQTLEIHLGGRPATPAELASALPVQAIHADIGSLVQGPPDARRRLLDWGVFHVKHDYLSVWRQFRRALQQRNAALRQNGPDDVLETWEGELALAAERVDECRRAYFERLATAFRRFGAELLGQDISVRYQRGWAESDDLAATLRAAREGDRSVGHTRIGPHRADLQFEIESERSRWRASKGQQKLLGAALILAQSDLVAAEGQRPVGLLVDEPAADLDREHLGRFIRTILAMDAQVFIAAISAEGLGLDRGAAMFHVEHGHAAALL